MAEAYGKLTGRPGLCLVTRAPGATHASVGVHTAYQDSTPLVLVVGQVPRSHLGREAFQELDYAQLFGEMAKWVADNISSKKVTGDELEAVVEFLASLSEHREAGRPDQEKVAAGQKFFALGTDMTDGTCYDCHAMKPKDDPEGLFQEPGMQRATGAPDLTGYGSAQWLRDFLSDPGHKRFYGSHNAMPAFGDQLSEQELHLLVEWLLHRWPELSASAEQ
jgi:acetolactate synthase-1/2/3 large subunit